MNKIIAELFSGILTLIHLAFIYILFLIGTEKRPEVIKYVPDFFLQSESRAGIIIALSIAYILLMGLISTFVSINTYLSEIKEILEKNNN